MRRTVRLTAAAIALSAVLSVAVVAVDAEPAAAAAPVQAFPWVPSSFVAGTTSAPPTLPPGYTEQEWDEWRVRDRQYRQTLIDQAKQRTWTPNTAPQPLSPPKAPTRGVGGGPLGTILMAPMIVGGLLQVIAVSAEGQALLGPHGTTEEIVCGGVGPTDGDWFLSWLYGTTDCGMVYSSPNVDSPTGYTSLSYGTWSRTYVAELPKTSSFGQVFCFAGSGDSLVGAVLQRKTDAGLWQTYSSSTLTGAPPNLSGNARLLSCGTPYVVSNPFNGDAWTEVGTDFRLVVGSSVVSTIEPLPSDPTRQARCRVGWSDGTESLGLGENYTEAGGLPISSTALGCEEAYAQRPSPGVMPEWVKVESDQGGSITEIADMPVPAEVEQPKPSEGLKLHRVIGTELRSCMTWEADCADWWTQSSNGTDTSKYRCTFGGEEISLVECGVYRRTFEDPADVKIGDPDPNEQFQYSWGTGTDPFTTPGGSTVTGGGACSPTWSWNPVDWVLNPLKCAFIPSSVSIATAQARVTDSWEETMPGKLPAIVATVFTPPTGSDGCEGPHVYFSLEAFVPGVAVDWYPLSACSDPGAQFAWWSRIISSAIMLYFAGLAIVRIIASVVNAQGVGTGSTGSSS